MQLNIQVYLIIHNTCIKSLASGKIIILVWSWVKQDKNDALLNSEADMLLTDRLNINMALIIFLSLVTISN
jgi:hypothetical protein